MNCATIKGAEKAPMPGFIFPCLATLRKTPPEGANWAHEIKFDGYRLQAHIKSGKVALYTRDGLDWTAKFGSAVVEWLAALPVGGAILDGEMVVESNGVSNFSLLQEALSEGRFDRFRYYAFDLLYAGGYDLRQAALVDRQAALAALLGDAKGPVRFKQ